MRSRKSRPVAIVSLGAALFAVVAFAIATNEYSFCILLENDCHALGRVESCAALTRTLRFCGIVYGIGFAATVVAIAAFVVGRMSAVTAR